MALDAEEKRKIVIGCQRLSELKRKSERIPLETNVTDCRGQCSSPQHQKFLAEWALFKNPDRAALTPSLPFPYGQWSTTPQVNVTIQGRQLQYPPGRFCETCIRHWRAREESHIKDIWDRLPGIFGLPAWNKLST